MISFDIYNSFGVNPMTFTYEPLSWSGSITFVLKVMIKSSLFCSLGMFATHSDSDCHGEDGDDGDVGEDDHGDGEDGEDGDHVNINNSLFCSLEMLSKPNRQLSADDTNVFQTKPNSFREVIQFSTQVAFVWSDSSKKEASHTCFFLSKNNLFALSYLKLRSRS